MQKLRVGAGNDLVRYNGCQELLAVWKSPLPPPVTGSDTEGCV